jgi:hypothetical protein
MTARGHALAVKKKNFSELVVSETLDSRSCFHGRRIGAEGNASEILVKVVTPRNRFHESEIAKRISLERASKGG